MELEGEFSNSKTEPIELNTKESNKHSVIDKKKNFQILSLIGEGAFSKVYKIRQDNTENALKILKPDENIKNVEREKEILELIESSKKIQDKTNLSSVLDFSVDSTNNNFLIFMELCQTDLEKIFRDLQNPGDMKTDVMAKKKILTLKDKYMLINDILGGLRQLNILKIMHRDIKPSNILINLVEIKETEYRLQAKIADFGLAKIVENESWLSNHTVGLGTPLYQAKELLQGSSKYSHKVDVWSSAIVFYQILYNDFPFIQPGEDKIKSIKDHKKWFKIVKEAEKRLFFPDEKYPDLYKFSVHKELKDLMKKMLRVEENDRCNWDDVFKHYDQFSEDLLKETN